MLSCYSFDLNILILEIQLAFEIQNITSSKENILTSTTNSVESF